MECNLHRPLTLAEIADHAAMSVRSLNRRFRAQTGSTPLQWLLRARVDLARELLETTELSIGQIADRTGLGAVRSWWLIPSSLRCPRVEMLWGGPGRGVGLAPWARGGGVGTVQWIMSAGDLSGLVLDR
ncbi:helix-turn-helix domain-containing protein, partial [Kitasatospora sp. NPDC018058]|uniref:helix-turn-helix domain-containing protein n=1 Tax=Kitasatospora sp. NPDC018058 TaxID=3364025 RepID=UPI0037C15378